MSETKIRPGEAIRNDGAVWTRERIAEWIDLVDPERPAPIAIELPIAVREKVTS